MEIKVKKIYQEKSSSGDGEVIFELDSGLKIIKRDENLVKKLNIQQWEEINFIPEDFSETERSITTEEEKELKKFLNKHFKKKQKQKQKGFWSKIIAGFLSFFSRDN